MIQRRNVGHQVLHQPDIFRNGIQYLQEPIGGFGVWNGQFEQPGFDAATNAGGWEAWPDNATSFVYRTTGGDAGNWCFRGGNTAANQVGGYLYSLCYIPVATSRSYGLLGTFRGSAAGATISFGCACYTAAKVFIAYALTINNVAPGLAWVNSDGVMGPGGTAWAANTHYARICVYLQGDHTQAAGVYAEVDNVMFMPCPPCWLGQQ
jgi:hypothetical protein